MNEMAAGASSLVAPGVVAGSIIIGLIVWFFVNRASVRASEQIRLLESLLEEQKKQNALMRRLIEAQLPDSAEKRNEEESEKRDFIRLIPER
ncbi:YebO family protein [[Erwinia] mediterraneensis]|uniref:YebO family protein n=1 Tax=[Erwinia] mediterraneensis TaxID=2161819 RepID=UPI001030123A|nr:YebO family protein [[Erwinia] mediterraneensis]